MLIIEYFTLKLTKKFIALDITALYSNEVDEV
jgi:hypothetical protein